jgi:hypothetical protein
MAFFGYSGVPADPYQNIIDGVTQAPEWGTQPAAPSWWDDLLAKQAAAGLSPGMEGTTTMYRPLSLSSGGYQGGNLTSTPTANNLGSVTFYTPETSNFVQPNEGWERFFNQALQGNVQEEYVTPAYSGQQGKDTSNFDVVQGLNPFQKDWNQANPYFKEISDTPFLKETFTDPGMLFTMAALLGPLAANAAFGAPGAGGATAGELSAIGPAQGSILEPGLQASGAMTYPVANPYAGIEAFGAGGAGGAMANELIYSDIGPAQGSVLPSGIQESGAITYPVEANPYAGITAKSTGSLWDTARNTMQKLPSMPSGMGGGQATGGGGGGEGEQMNLWSDTVSPYGFDPVRAYQPNYLNIPQAAYPFEAELQRRLALIRGAQ